MDGIGIFRGFEAFGHEARACAGTPECEQEQEHAEHDRAAAQGGKRYRNRGNGGLKPETIRRLGPLGEELDGGDRSRRSIRADRDRPITGTRLLCEWQGVEQIVTVGGSLPSPR